VFLRAVDDVYTLERFRSRKKFAAGNGGNGGIRLRTGAHGDDLSIDVPAGTVVIDVEDGSLVQDLKRPGDTALVAHGGRGGWGNKKFASSTNQAPNYSQKGQQGEEVRLRLELRLLADVGLIGLPNAGKSTLLAAVSNAKPKIAEYPFTTLEPMLGVVNVGFERFTMADLPGLIEGASEGYGLGFEFLKHVRRCRVLLHLVDCTSPDPVTDFELIEGEVTVYEPRLEELARVVAVTKADIDAAQARTSARALTEHTGLEVPVLSAEDGSGLEALKERLVVLVREAKQAEEEAPPEEVPVLRPAGEERFIVRSGGDGVFEVEGQRIVSFVGMMDTEMEGAGDEIVRRLERWGVAAELRRKGARRGSRVRFGEVELAFEG
jgi:GTP-binding protein